MTFTLGYTGYLERNFGVGVEFYGEYWRFDYRITAESATTQVRATGEIDTFIPSIGVVINWSPSDRWLFTFGPRGVWMDISDREIWFANVTAWARFFLCSSSFIFVRGSMGSARLQDHRRFGRRFRYGPLQFLESIRRFRNPLLTILKLMV